MMGGWRSRFNFYFGWGATNKTNIMGIWRFIICVENGDLEVVFVDREWEKNGEVKECEVGRVHHLAVILIYIYYI